MNECNFFVIPRQTFREGTRCRAIQFSFSTKEPTRMFWLGYWIWGLDIWCGNLPVLKVLIAVNILNIILMWIVR